MPTLLAAVAPLLPLLFWTALSPLERTMLLLIGLVGGVTFRFSRRYLDGAPHLPRYERWFIATLAGAAGVVVADDLIVIALAWTATSLALHQLLTVGEPRAAAQVVAHKKFLLSRLADACLGIAVALLVTHFGTSDVATLLARAEALPELPGRVQLAGALLAAGVVLRSAQLPFHGWLISVMEAPTPVSALLHAGIVNLGAFVCIELGPLMGRLAVAQGMLLAMGTLTAVLAGLVLLTRGSVKGALAWSTAAQMGFVLVECGLGAYDLALLHLVAHALYKAYAFLSSGSTVVRAARSAALPPQAAPSLVRWGLAALAATGVVLGVAALTWGEALARPAMRVSAAVLTLAVTATLAHAEWRDGWRALRPAIAVAVGLPLLYALWHPLVAPLVPAIAAPAVPAALVGAVGVAFLALFAVQAIVTAHPASALARALHPHAVAGFHLDAVFTRLTFRVWPPTITAPRTVARPTETTIAASRAA